MCEDDTNENVGDPDGFERLKAELSHVFAAPETDYVPLTAAVIIARNATD